VDIKRHAAAAFLVGSSIGLAGCQSTSLGGLAFWSKGDGTSVASAAPDVSQQRYDGLSQQLVGNSARPSGQALGAPLPADNDNFLVASWKKTSAAVGGAFGAKAADQQTEDDPLRLDRAPKKVGPEVYVAAARLLENQGKIPEAEAQYQKALEASATDLNALVGLARLHDRQGRWQEAVSLYQKALKAHPTSGLLQNDLGLCYARQKQFEPSLLALRKAVELQPANSKYRNNLAAVLVETGQIDEAVKHLTVHNSPAVAHYNIGYLLEQRGRPADALRHCQQALALDPDLAPARQMVAQLSGGNQLAPSAGAQHGSAPARTQQVPLSATYPTARATVAQSMAAPPAETPANPYITRSQAPSAATPLPQLPATAQAPPASFHISDDGPAAHTATGMRLLPPAE
jgi:tetratricopeptide (TPR) repeat protein